MTHTRGIYQKDKEKLKGKARGPRLEDMNQRRPGDLLDMLSNNK